MSTLHLPQLNKAIASLLLCTISVIAAWGQHNSLATAPGDAAHPERIQATKAKSFTDIVGTWKRTDGLLAEKTYSTQPAGVSYTESETIEISADGKFKHIKVHSHYSGTCSQTNGKTEYGIIKLDGTKLIFEIQSGTEMVEDACSPSLNRHQAVKPRKESFPWSIKTNPDNNAITLCWNTSNTTATCF